MIFNTSSFGEGRWDIFNVLFFSIDWLKKEK